MQEEHFGARDLHYSLWHRARSTQRYIGIEAAQRLTMCDVDSTLWLEYDPGTKEPLCLIEAARDVGQVYKTATALTNLARRAGVPCYVVLYALSDRPNPADSRGKDIAAMRVRRAWPKPDRRWRVVSPAEYARGLLAVREWSAARLDREAANDPLYEV